MGPKTFRQWLLLSILVIGLGIMAISSLDARNRANRAFDSLAFEIVDRQYDQCVTSQENRQAFIDLIDLAVPANSTNPAALEFRRQVEAKGLIKPVDCSAEKKAADALEK